MVLQEPFSLENKENFENELCSISYTRASALHIMINASSVWNTIYLSMAIEYQKGLGDFNEDLLLHMPTLG